MQKGSHHTDEARAKLRLARLGKPTGRAPNKGKHFSDEVRAKLSASHSGENHYQYGKPLSEEHKAKISASLIGKRPSKETRAKLSRASKARWQDPKYRAMMSAIHKEQCQGPEWRAKRSELSKALWQDHEYAQKVWESWKAKPNQIELRLQDILNRHFPSEWKFVGDGQLIIGGRCPDFVNVNGKKELIELFGTYFHPVFDVAHRKEHYKQYGFQVAIIWEDELEDEERLVKTLGKKFRR